jgi:addiction module HigA family antidote
MHNPPHPGEFIMATYMEPFGLSCRYLAEQLDVSPSTLNRVLKQQSGVSPEMALRLSKSLGRTLKVGLPCKIPMTFGRWARVSSSIEFTRSN